jgi:predicted dehydrogenase
MTKWAIVGTGTIAQQFAADLGLSKRSTLSAVASRDAERSRAFIAAAGGKAAAMSFDEALHSRDVDAVYLATPNRLHAEQAIQALAAGKPVLIEKPMATTATDAERIVEAARRNNVLAMEAMWMRFTPAVVRLKELVREGAIGEIRQLHANLAFATPYTADHPAYDPVHGGAALDLGVYPISLMVHLLGEPLRWASSAVGAETGAVTSGALIATYPEAVATTSYSFAAEGDNEATIVGARGMIRVSRPFISSPMLTVRKVAPPPASAAAEAPPTRFSPPKDFALKSLLAPIVKSERKPFLFEGRGLHFQADHFGGLLERGLKESPVMPLAESVEVVRMAQGAGSGANVDRGR